MSIEAMKQALEAFRKIHEGCGFVKEDNLNKHTNDLATLVRKDCNFAMEDLHQAIEQAENAVLEEREACAKVCESMDHDGVMIAADCAKAIRARGAPVHASDMTKERVDETAKDRQGWAMQQMVDENQRLGLYDAPKEWVGLTDGEMVDLLKKYEGRLWVDVFRVIEAKLKEKNT